MMMNARRSMLILATAVAGITLSSSLHAQASACDIKRSVGTKALDEATWKQLNKAHEDVAEERYD